MKISFTGDVAFSRYFSGLYNKTNLVDDKILRFLNDCDYTVVNVEGAISSGQGSAKKALVHANSPEILGFLRKINGNIWNLANNHIIDSGEEGLKSTVDFALKNGFQTIGVGANMEQASNPVILKDQNGVRVGIFSVTQHETPEATDNSCGCLRYDNYRKIKEIIKKIKSQCDWCVIVVHAGEEFNAVPLPYIRKRYRKYINWGADVVVGHHPHVVENYEKVGNKIIFYSLGNFVFDTDYQRKQDYTEYGALVKIDFNKKTFAFESIGTKIDRENQTISTCETPVIFTNIDKKLYKKLWPLSATVLRINERIKFAIIYPSKKDFNEEQWREWEINRKNDVEKDITKGEKKYVRGAWKSAPQELIEYVKGSRL